MSADDINDNLVISLGGIKVSTTARTSNDQDTGEEPSIQVSNTFKPDQKGKSKVKAATNWKSPEAENSDTAGNSEKMKGKVKKTLKTDSEKPEKTEKTSATGKTGKSTAKRGRNWTAEEIACLAKEAGSASRVLHGRHGPNLSNQFKEKKWKDIALKVNGVNAGDRTWQQVRKKWQDLESSTRVKERKVIVERRKTGGGVSNAEPLTQLEEMIAVEQPSWYVTNQSADLVRHSYLL